MAVMKWEVDSDAIAARALLTRGRQTNPNRETQAWSKTAMDQAIGKQA